MDKANIPQLVDARGNPLARLAVDTPHDGASNVLNETSTWQPAYYSADDEILRDRKKLLARTQDLIRNNGLTSGAVQTHLDWIIGSGLELNCKPDWKLLKIKDKDAAREWERDTESKFRQWADDPDCYCDASRGMRFREILAQSYRSYLTSFEIFQVVEWLPDRGSTKKTAIQTIEPMRVSNPNGKPNTDRLRDGVAFDELGVPVGYWFVNRLENDSASGSYKMREWQFVPKETPWGRPMVIHIYDRERAGQTRGKNTGVAATLTKLKMHDKFSQVTLQAAVLNAMYAASIESPMDWHSVGSALGVGPNNASPMAQYTKEKAAFHKEKTIQYNGVRIPHLYPGEELKFNSVEHPTAQYEQFERSVLRYIAAGWNMPYEQLSRDYSQTNYTGFRAAMLTAWQFFAGRQVFIGGRDASIIYSLWLEEAFNDGTITTLPGTPDFYDAKGAWCGCEWIGPGRGTLDPLREREATKVAFSMGLTTMEIEAAQEGLRWEELLEQTAQEIQFRRKIEQEYGLEKGALDPVIDGAAKTSEQLDDEDKKQNGAGNPADTEDEDAKKDEDEQNTPAADKKKKQAVKFGATHIHLGDVAPAGDDAGIKHAMGQIAHAIGALAEYQRNLAETLQRSQDENTRVIAETLSKELAKPVIPVYKDGKLSHAQRVNQV